ncbi:MAG TPA: hypothetical protein QF861_07590, partial [Alphaproteobacteria bacterium]|nr:hypothetical protein [Alphaproteobacteria bacterium]
REDQKTDRSKTPLEPSTTSGLTSNQDEPDPPVKNRLNSPECFDDGQQQTKWRQETPFCNPKKVQDRLSVLACKASEEALGRVWGSGDGDGVILGRGAQDISAEWR